MASLRTLRRDAQPWAYGLVELAQRAGYRVTVNSVKRSSADQARLYRQAQAGLSRFPAAPPGSSMHEQGLAFDISVPGHPEVLRALGAVWERAGFTWGGRFGDPIHFDFRAHR